MLTRYWFRFSNPKPFSSLGLGCGITAYDEDDARAMLNERVFAQLKEYPEIREVIANIDIRTLDQGHVIPNMGIPVVRGVWFPRGL